jgi:N-acetylglucosamine-6-phosphate deacetylase
MKAKKRRGPAPVLQPGLIDVQVHSVDCLDFHQHMILDDIGERFGYTFQLHNAL